jgi:hypothetical protein
MSRIDYELYKSLDSPGPGNYDSKIKPLTPSYSFQGKRKPAKPNETPGPGAYQPERASSKTPKNPFIGKSERKELSSIIDSPGPGTYDLKIMKKTPSWTFHGTSPKMPGETILGPGRYEQSISYSASLGITPRSPRPDLFASTVESPGPGRYSEKSETFKAKTYSFGNGNRPVVKSDTPGPGNYEQNNRGKSVAFKFGKEIKKTLTVASEAPSAIYDPKILKKTPSFTFGVKVQEKIGNQFPGPGSYEVVEKQQKVFHSKTSKSLRFQMSFSEKETLEKPGPGKYDFENGRKKFKPDTSKAQRFYVKKNDLPGPGQYNPIKV